MTVSEAIRAATAELAATSDTARLDAELLMAHALCVSRSDMLIRLMDEPAPADFHRMVGRRSKHEPVAYITGIQEFYGRPFKVTRDTLIPRPDSELIVDIALEVMGDPTDSKMPNVLDLGTGTGALLLSVLAERPDLIGKGIDQSAAAVCVAQSNARELGLSHRAHIRVGRWHEERDSYGYSWAQNIREVDLVLANPPYVEGGAKLDPQVSEFEPHDALFAGPDGLTDYRMIIPELPELLWPGGVAVLEIGHTQADAVTNIAQNAGFAVEMRHDLAGRPRVLILS